MHASQLKQQRSFPQFKNINFATNISISFLLSFLETEKEFCCQSPGKLSFFHATLSNLIAISNTLEVKKKLSPRIIYYFILC